MILVGKPKAEVRERAARIEEAFVRLVDKDEVRERKFNTQSGTCLICLKPLPGWDGIQTHIDHAFRIIWCAELYIPLEDAIRLANRDGNLTLAHASCNLSKSARDLEEYHQMLASEGKEAPVRSKLTPEVLTLILERRRQKNSKAQNGGANKGKHLSAATRLKLSKAHKGKKNWKWGKHLSEATRAKISEALRGRFTGEKNHNWGKSLSKAHRKKISKGLEGRPVSEATRLKISNSEKATRLKMSEAARKQPEQPEQQ